MAAQVHPPVLHPLYCFERKTSTEPLGKSPAALHPSTTALSTKAVTRPIRIGSMERNVPKPINVSLNFQCKPILLEEQNINEWGIPGNEESLSEAVNKLHGEGDNMISNKRQGSQSESWRSFLSVQSPTLNEGGAKKIFLGSPLAFAGDSAISNEDEEVDLLKIGSRADFIIRRPSSSALERSTSALKILATEEDLSESPSRARLTPITTSSSFKVAQSGEVEETLVSPLSTDQENERANWPTSRRRNTMDSTEERRPHRALFLSPQAPGRNTTRSKSDIIHADVQISADYRQKKADSMPSCMSHDKPWSDNAVTSLGEYLDDLSIDASQGTDHANDQDRVISTPDKRITVSTSATDHQVIIHMPGFDSDAITLTLKGTGRRTLHVLANRWDSDKTERFERRITFGIDADLSLIRARFEDDHLYVNVPRKPLSPRVQDNIITKCQPTSAPLPLSTIEEASQDLPLHGKDSQF